MAAAIRSHIEPETFMKLSWILSIEEKLIKITIKIKVLT